MSRGKNRRASGKADRALSRSLQFAAIEPTFIVECVKHTRDESDRHVALVGEDLADPRLAYTEPLSQSLLRHLPAVHDRLNPVLDVDAKRLNRKNFFFCLVLRSNHDASLP
jgi:hypothetical protein